MGILRFVVQGFGWEVGRAAAKESLEAIAEEAPPVPAPSKRELVAAEKERRRAEAARKAQIEAELQRLKKQR